MRKRIISLLMLVTANCFGGTLSVSPSYHEISTKPGESIKETVTIYNSGNEPMKVSLSVGDFWFDEKNNRIFPAPGSSPFSAATWIVLNEKEMTIPPKGQKEVNFLLSAPPEPKPAGFASLFVEKVSSRPDSQVGLTLRIAVPILYRNEALKLGKLSISEFSFDRPSGFQPLTLRFQLKNDLNHYLFPQANAVVVRMEDKAFVAKEELKKDRIVLPSQSLAFQMGIPMDLKSGNYEGVLTVTAENEQPLVKTFSFTVP